ncbi:protein phosphatase 2A regulatory subunit cdc55 [Hanseniaspora osmophila]
MSLDNYDFKFSQCFGDKADIVVTEADIITSVEFDHTGDYLATGDRGGRVVLFERNLNSKKHCEYKFMTEFQSHDAEFDYLKSLEIEEKINQIKWCKYTNNSHFLLSTNDKTIKLWKIYEKNIKLVSENNLSTGLFNGGSDANIINNNNSNNSNNINGGTDIKKLSALKLPRLTNHDKIVAASPKRIYSNAHTYHINSISPNSDGETFLSCDDLRINLWSLDIPDQSFNIVDIKPANMEELTEVITSAEFHPSHCNYFMYASSKGTIKLCDMRTNALCDNYQAKVFEEYTDPSTHNFFTEITSSISDVKFSPCGRYIASRDYLTVKIWDINMNNKPLQTLHIHDQLKDKLSDTYENDAIFDKFEVGWQGNSKSVMTGSYNNNFMIYPNVLGSDTSKLNVPPGSASSSSSTNSNTTTSITTNGSTHSITDHTDQEYDYKNVIKLQADKNAFKSASNNINMNVQNGSNGNGYWGSEDNGSSSRNISDGAGAGGLHGHGHGQQMALQEEIDYKKSILHFSWHPRENSVAIAATNNLFIFSSL